MAAEKRLQKFQVAFGLASRREVQVGLVLIGLIGSPLKLLDRHLRRRDNAIVGLALANLILT